MDLTGVTLFVRTKADLELAAQIDATDVPDATRAHTREIVQQLANRGVQVRRASNGPEGGITLRATGQRAGCYASIDVYNEDVIVGVTSAADAWILDSDDLEAALDEAARFLSPV